jgi:hypothetical protein
VTHFLEILSEALATAGGWSGFTLASGSTLPRAGSVSWPYRTASAEKVWEVAKQIIPRYPNLNEREVLCTAVKDAGVNPLDLTAEDWRLLEMAIEWYKNGFTGISTTGFGDDSGVSVPDRTSVDR